MVMDEKHNEILKWLNNMGGDYEWPDIMIQKRYTFFHFFCI